MDGDCYLSIVSQSDTRSQLTLRRMHAITEQQCIYKASLPLVWSSYTKPSATAELLEHCTDNMTRLHTTAITAATQHPTIQLQQEWPTRQYVLLVMQINCECISCYRRQLLPQAAAAPASAPLHMLA